ncbi:ATP-dependent DNA ligase [Alicyclobacillus sp. ALC3]|uniref:ATP-dependent DNA ligase n=1 Tax=Alicyclobacillus sp. ALC3 TaxID=2796143 RepID=UPI002378D17A|nr:RNA ligase family protein [Alicyclobacillus sp. ALC3]WDL97243.1 DNA ligase [Alicyclobacillus sp. ALC3]
MEVITPMEPVVADHVPEGPRWITQVKWDGVRLLTYAQTASSVRLFNRHGRERTVQYPELLDVHSYCSQTPVILDGEVIALGPSGTPDFHEVMRRDGVRRPERVPGLLNTVPIAYMVFDILFWQGNWITTWPLWKRQELLQSALSPHPTVHYVESEADGTALFFAMEIKKMEGVVAKHLDSPYRVGQKHGDWRKVKFYRDVTAVIGGFTTDHAGVPNALVLGLYDAQGDFWLVGQVGPGKLSRTEWTDLIRRLRDSVAPVCPFTRRPRIQRVTWVAPTVTVKVLYRELTRERLLRQPTLQSLTTAAAAACTWDREGLAST